MEIEIALWYIRYILRHYVPGISENMVSSYVYDKLKYQGSRDEAARTARMVEKSNSLGDLQDVLEDSNLAVKSILQEGLEVNHPKNHNFNPQLDLEFVKETSVILPVVVRNRLPFKNERKRRIDKLENYVSSFSQSRPNV